MAFSISDFSSNINRLGTAKTNLFEVVITVPERLQILQQYINTRDLTFRASAVQLPQLDINTKTFYPQSIGRGQKRAMGLSEFSVVPIKFVVDGNHGVVKFFHNWIKHIVNYDISGGPDQANLLGMQSYEVGYKEDYASQVTINVYSDNIDAVVYRYELLNAYPINTPSLSFDWNNQNQILELDVGFTYDAIKLSGVEENNLTLLDPFFQPFGTLNDITTGALDANTTSSQTETVSIP